MEYLDVVLKHEGRIFEELREEILNDRLIQLKIKDDLNEFLEFQTSLLKEFLESFNKGFDFRKVKNFYEKYDVEFEVIYRSLNVVKEKIIVLLKRERLKLVDIYAFSNYFDKFLDEIAKIYVKRLSAKLKHLMDGNVFKNKLLIKVHVEWLEKIAMAIEKDEIQYFPLVSLKYCEFSKYLYYPESLMICLDKKLCIYLEDMHKVVHRLADTFYLHFKNEEYSEGYFVFKDFIQQLEKFLETIADMYYVSLSNPEKSFLKFLELVKFDSQIFVSMVAIKNYEELLKEYSEKELEEAVSNVCVRLEKSLDSQKSLLVKGFNYIIFMVHIGITSKEYVNFAYRVKEYFKNIGGMKIEPVMVGFELEMYKDIKAFEIIEVLDRLKEKAIKENRDVLVLVDEEKEQINRMIHDKYDGAFILNALDNGDIEIVAQPIFDKTTNTIFALEVLGRIKDFKKLVPMKELLKKIEDMGLTRTLDLLVGIKLKESSTLISKISNILFINVDFETLLNKNYLDGLKKLQDGVGKIVLEIKKIDFLSQYKILENIHRDYGFTFAIDNFSVQCISLYQFVYLVERGIVEYLKIGKKALENDVILKILKSIDENTNATLIFKYVENEKTYNKLIQYGFRYVQGFYFSAPKLIEEIIIDD